MTQEALKLALEALDNLMYWDNGKPDYDEAREAITAIKEALTLPDPYKQGYADAMNWKVQNHLEHLPTAQPEQEPVAIMREMLEVQGQHGNWNYDSYMHGLYNGMEYMVALAEKREPKFRDAPDDWLAKYEVKRDNFNSTEPLTEATPPKQEPVKYSDYEPDGVHHNKPAQPEQKLIGTVGDLFDDRVIAHRKLDRDLLVYIKEKNT